MNAWCQLAHYSNQASSIWRGSDPTCYVLIGAPGSGKTSAARMVLSSYPGTAHYGVKRFALKLLDMGCTEVESMREAIEAGKTLPDHDVRRLLGIFLSGIETASRRIIVEGYPHNEQQFFDLYELARASRILIGGLIILNITDEISLARTAQRLACPRCGTPSVPGVSSSTCPFCSGQMQRRDDDETGRAQRRLADYRRVQDVLVPLFTQRAAVWKIDGILPPAEIARAIGTVMASR
jgi:adenylate kinase